MEGPGKTPALARVKRSIARHGTEAGNGLSGRHEGRGYRKTEPE